MPQLWGGNFSDVCQDFRPGGVLTTKQSTDWRAFETGRLYVPKGGFCRYFICFNQKSFWTKTVVCRFLHWFLHNTCIIGCLGLYAGAIHGQSINFFCIISRNCNYGSVAVKCKNFYILKCKFFLLKIAYTFRKQIKNFLNFKMLTLQNVKFEMSEYSNTTYFFLFIVQIISYFSLGLLL